MVVVKEVVMKVFFRLIWIMWSLLLLATKPVAPIAKQIKKSATPAAPIIQNIEWQNQTISNTLVL
ncbi:MAG: hypothetical protein LBT69_03550 [Lactobacillales bacterium]|nr:hypothetical protein [Lactobacillales bacterium]